MFGPVRKETSPTLALGNGHRAYGGCRCPNLNTFFGPFGRKIKFVHVLLSHLRCGANGRFSSCAAKASTSGRLLAGPFAKFLNHKVSCAIFYLK